MTGVGQNWSHSTTLAATPISASRARSFVSHHLIEHRLPYLVDSVCLVASELATNALMHGRTAFVVTLSGEDGTIRVTVSDDSDWIDSRGTRPGLRVGGRGLTIVSVVSHDWGVIPTLGSKTVWASFDAQPRRPS